MAKVTEKTTTAPAGPVHEVTTTSTTDSWIESVVKQVIGAFLLAFLGPVVAAGAGWVHLATWRAALIAAVAAGLKTLEAIASDVVDPGSTSLLSALKARLNR